VYVSVLGVCTDASGALCDVWGGGTYRTALLDEEIPLSDSLPGSTEQLSGTPQAPFFGLSLNSEEKHVTFSTPKRTHRRSLSYTPFTPGVTDLRDGAGRGGDEGKKKIMPKTQSDRGLPRRSVKRPLFESESKSVTSDFVRGELQRMAKEGQSPARSPDTPGLKRTRLSQVEETSDDTTTDDASSTPRTFLTQSAGCHPRPLPAESPSAGDLLQLIDPDAFSRSSGASGQRASPAGVQQKRQERSLSRTGQVRTVGDRSLYRLMQSRQYHNEK